MSKGNNKVGMVMTTTLAGLVQGVTTSGGVTRPDLRKGVE